MSGVVCVWAAGLSAPAEQWYEDVYIPDISARHSTGASLGDMVETPLDPEFEGVATRDAQWKSLTVYESENVQDSIDASYERSNHPPPDQLMEGSRLDIRAYELIKAWQNDEVEKFDAANIASLLFFEWQPREGYEEAVTEFYRTDIGPLFSQAPEVLRLRWFKIRNASVLENESYNTLLPEQVHTHMVLVEMVCEDWPWGEIFALNALEKWSEYFEDQKAVKWQASCYTVRRTYPDVDASYDAPT